MYAGQNIEPWAGTTTTLTGISKNPVTEEFNVVTTGARRPIADYYDPTCIKSLTYLV